MATSGTVSQTVYTTRQIIDQAFRACKMTPQQITPEHLTTALETLYLLFSRLTNRGVPLWCITENVLGLYQNRQSVPLPLGTVDLLNINFRTVARLTGTPSSSSGVAEEAFDGDLETACTLLAVAGFIQLELEEAASPTTFGVLPNATGDWTFTIQTSHDGVFFTTVATYTDQPMVAGEWLWFDVQGIIDVEYVRIVGGVATTLDVTEFVIAATPNEIPMAPLNRDDYTNLPNKTFQGRPVQYWFDKQIPIPRLWIWPTASAQFVFSQITIWTKRYIQDVGTLRQQIEVPQGWYLAIIMELASKLALLIKEVDPALIPTLKAEAKTEMDDAWAGQTDNSPINLRPNISPYTK